jgi:DNA-binding response OmpR family regulator
MQDQPTPSEILAAVAAFLRTVVAAETTGATAFQARVGANALEMMRRQLDLAPAEETAELERLRVLLNTDGSLFDLNAELARRICDGELDLTNPGLAEHLWATTLAKLAVDQPTYSGYRAALAERAEAEAPKEA